MKKRTNLIDVAQDYEWNSPMLPTIIYRQLCPTSQARSLKTVIPANKFTDFNTVVSQPVIIVNNEPEE